jgi:photosystem II stability/assembly factor-like uncharacterized protein
MNDGAQTVFFSSDGGKTFGTAMLPGNVVLDVFDWERDSMGAPTGVVFLGGNAALYRSTDYGQTWAAWGAGPPAGKTPTSLSVNPKDSTHALLAAGSCLSATTNGGSTWGACTTPSPKAAAIRVVSIRPDDPTKVIALTDAGEVLHSADSGATWSAVTASLVTGWIPGAGLSRHLSYSPSGKTIVLTAASGTPGKVGVRVLRSVDDGTTWTDETQGMVTIQINNVAWDGADLYLATSGQSILRRTQFGP